MASRRIDRDLARGRRAASRVRQQGGATLAATYAHIEATFSSAMRHSLFKDRVAALISGGPGHHAARARYGPLAEQHPVSNVTAALALVARMRNAEVEARATAIRIWGSSSRPRLALAILDELNLILRVMRRYEPSIYPKMLSAVRSAKADDEQDRSAFVEAAE
jgi:hypothetical protein